MREVKKSSNAFVKEKRFTKFKFDWQDGYGAFSYSHSALDNVIAYIQKQKEHHKKKTFKQEYIGFLKKFKLNTMKSICLNGLMISGLVDLEEVICL